MPFGWHRRQPLEQDATAEKVDAQRPRKRDLLRQLLSGLSRDTRQPRAASIPSIVEPEVCIAPLPTNCSARPLTCPWPRSARAVSPSLSEA